MATLVWSIVHDAVNVLQEIEHNVGTGALEGDWLVSSSTRILRHAFDESDAIMYLAEKPSQAYTH